MNNLIDNFKRGTSAGVGAGLVVAIIWDILQIMAFFALIFLTGKNLIEINGVGFMIDMSSSNLLGFIINCIWIGVIVGILYMLFYAYIPGNTSIKKGLFIGFIFGVINIIFMITSMTLITNSYIFLIWTALKIFGLWLFFGFLLGYFWDKFE